MPDFALQIPERVGSRFLINGRLPLLPEHLKFACDQQKYPTGEFWKLANSFTYRRGRLPSVAHALVTRKQLDDSTFRDFQTLRNEITIEDGLTTLEVKRLAITKAVAILPGFRNEDEPNSSETTAYAIRLEDARAFAPTTTINKGVEFKFSANVTDGNSIQKSSYREVAEWVWDEYLKPVFGGESLEWKAAHRSTQFKNPEGFKWHGVSAWDAFWEVLDYGDWDFVLTLDGKCQVVDGDDNDANDVIFNQAWRKVLLDSIESQTKIWLPEKIVGYAHQRNYQFGKNLSECDLDAYASDPVYEKEWPVTRFIANDNTMPVIEGTKAAVWTAMRLLYDDRGEKTNQTDVDSELEVAARAYVHGLVDEYQNRQYVFSMLMPFDLDGRFNEITWGDTGGGMKTVVRTVRQSRPVLDRQAQPPDLNRVHVPYHRWFLGRAKSTNNDAKRGDSVTIIPDSIHVDQDNTATFEAQPHERSAILAETVKVAKGQAFRCEWNNQPGIGGRWIAYPVCCDAIPEPSEVWSTPPDSFSLFEFTWSSPTVNGLLSALPYWAGLARQTLNYRVAYIREYHPNAPTGIPSDVVDNAVGARVKFDWVRFTTRTSNLEIVNGFTMNIAIGANNNMFWGGLTAVQQHRFELLTPRLNVGMLQVPAIASGQNEVLIQGSESFECLGQLRQWRADNPDQNLFGQNSVPPFYIVVYPEDATTVYFQDGILVTNLRLEVDVA